MNGNVTSARTIRSVLIANRGEIAVRIAKGANSLGLKTVAVYSSADENAPHVRACDDAALLGPAHASESYLNIDRIIEVACEMGVDAVHPGYGFLSENAEFAARVVEAGLVFVGPPASAIESMGDKAKAKLLLGDANVPLIPGYQGDDQTDETLTAKAETIGFPLMVKAAAGGGGKGMRRVNTPDALPRALELARAEALAAFGNGHLILERLVEHAHHVEIQVFADNYGHVVHLGERDCSLQRRHQKVIEEAPSPVVSQALRNAMGAAACNAARAVDYRGAGTVEFLVDVDENFFFLEMNTRLQVEHPVTEMVTQLDLVQAQFEVAMGAPLRFSQSDISLSGHAIEARLYAENPGKRFLPGPGRVLLWRSPDGVRVDTGVESGTDVSPHYDPMLAKIIAHGPNRELARYKLIQALQNLICFGVPTNRAFLVQLLALDAFENGEAHTQFIDSLDITLTASFEDACVEAVAAAAVLRHVALWNRCNDGLDAGAHELLNFANGERPSSVHAFTVNRKPITATTTGLGPDRYNVNWNGDDIFVRTLAVHAPDAALVIDGKRMAVTFCGDDASDWYIGMGERTFKLEAPKVKRSAAQDDDSAVHVTAPMHGRLSDILMSVGQSVKRGQHVASVEAMKMHHEVRAAREGVIKSIRVELGQQVVEGAVIADFE